MSGLMGSMAFGMATGVGMSVTRCLVDAVVGPRLTEVPQQQPQDFASTHEAWMDSPALQWA